MLATVFSPVSQEQWDYPLESFCKRWTVAWPGSGGWAWSNQSDSSWGCHFLPSSSPPCPSHGTRSREARRCGAELGKERARTSALARRRRWSQGRTYARHEKNKYFHKLAEMFHHHQQSAELWWRERNNTKNSIFPFKKISICNITAVKLLCDLC